MVVEDGTGKVDANSLVSVAFADTYFSERLNTAWGLLTTEVKEASLIKATDYFEVRFGNSLLGSRMYPDNPQALSFPRVDSNGSVIGTTIYDVDNVTIIGYDSPTMIKRAICEYAIRASSGSLIKDISSDALLSSRVKVGNIEKETNFTQNTRRPDLYNTYPLADGMVKPYLKSSSGQVIR